jgi:hypothetical protein
MKTYDATIASQREKDGMAKDPYWLYQWGPWIDDVNWKGLLNDGYTHVQTCDGLYLMSKFGPIGSAI